MKTSPITRLFVLFLCFPLWLSGCSNPNQDLVRIAINPWPGYEFLHLAKSKGFFKEAGLNIELIEMASLADVQRVYIQGRADGLASTIIEAVHAAGNTQESLSIVHIPDYSNGGDIILAHQSIKTVKDLKGKKIGAEIGSLGMYILSLALEKNGLQLSDVEILNVEQLAGEEAMVNGEIDAFVTYPPFSGAIQKHEQFKQILDTSELPGDVIDSIALRTSVLKGKPQWVNQFLKVWDKALEYAQTHKKEAYEIMAKREGISSAEFEGALAGLQLMSAEQSQRNMASKNMSKNIDKVCRTLAEAKTITFSCNNINQLLLPYLIN